VDINLLTPDPYPKKFLHIHIPGVGKLRPAGRMRPARPFYAARRNLLKLLPM